MQFYVQLILLGRRVGGNIAQCNIPCNSSKQCERVAKTVVESATWSYFLQQFQPTFCNESRDKLHEKLLSVTVPSGAGIHKPQLVSA